MKDMAKDLAKRGLLTLRLGCKAEGPWFSMQKRLKETVLGGKERLTRKRSLEVAFDSMQ